jgi:hypothetical protein
LPRAPNTALIVVRFRQKNAALTPPRHGRLDEQPSGGPAILLESARLAASLKAASASISARAYRQAICRR